MIQYELPPLGYDFNALEPVISQEIMQLHYTKHHQTYVTNLNKAIEQYQEAEVKGDIAKMISLQAAIKFNGGGHVNHSIFWSILAPPSQGGGQFADGPLKEAITHDFSSFDAFKDEMSAKTAAIQGSGWGWLGLNPTKKRLEIATCDNQDPLSTKGLIPLLGIDVWEHAYYLQYKNVRLDYVKAIWSIINWKNVEQRYQEALKK